MHGASKSIRTVSGRIPRSFLTFVAPPRKQITCHLFCFCSSCLPLLVLSPRAHGLISYSGTYFSTCSTLTTLFVPQQHYGVSANSSGHCSDLEFSIISPLFYNLGYAKHGGICDDRNKLPGPRKGPVLQ